MKIVCDNCSTKYSIADEKVRGKVFKIKCKKCSHIIVVKGTEGADAGGAAPAPGPGFDQKETRVFDYSGFEGQGEAVWHLVIDREQVGPMSPAEMKQKMDAGQIDGETYAWKEGMGDWQRIAAIPELTFLVTGGAPPQAPGNEDVGAAQTTIGSNEDAGGGLFGSPDQQQQVTGKADPADLFAAAAASSVDDEGGDLFGGRGGGDFAGQAAPMAAAPAPSAGRRSVPKEDIFGGGGGGGMAAETTAPSRGGGGGGGGAGMTGQRNENSVLFSLSNLAALASDSPKASSGSSGSSGSMGAATSSAFQSGGGSEGSGLIDIRAMAAVTLGNKGGDPGLPKPASAVDDLPVFSGGGGLSAPSAGVLLPSVASRGGDNKKLIIIVGSIIGVLLIAAVALLVIVLKPAPQPAIAVAPPAEKVGSDDNGDKPAPTPEGDKKPAETPPATPPGGAVTPPPGETPGVAPPVEDKKPEEKKPTSSRDDRPSRPTPPREDRPKPEPAEPKPAKEPAAAKCDEVSCAIDPSLPCCSKKSGGGTKSGGGDSGLPDSLGREDIKSGMATVKGRVAQCNDQYKQAGTVEVKISINGDGAVTSAQTTGKFAGTPTGSCVERAVKAAKFKRWKGPSVSVKYPFQFQ